MWCLARLIVYNKHTYSEFSAPNHTDQNRQKLGLDPARRTDGRRDLDYFSPTDSTWAKQPTSTSKLDNKTTSKHKKNGDHPTFTDLLRRRIGDMITNPRHTSTTAFWDTTIRYGDEWPTYVTRKQGQVDNSETGQLVWCWVLFASWTRVYKTSRESWYRNHELSTTLVVHDVVITIK